MKKILLAGIFCANAFLAFAQQPQQPKEVTDFNNYTKDIETQRRAASEKKDYALADKVLKEWVNQYDQSSTIVKDRFKGTAPGIYYNIACYDNLQGHKADALAALEKSVSLGYTNYSNTAVDTDLENLHNEPRFKAALQTLRERGDMGYILQKSGPYRKDLSKDLPSFSYQPATAPELVIFKNKFNLDSVKGNQDEISQIKNLLYWVHNVVRHDGNSDNPKSKNATDIIAICQTEKRGVNCRMMATILKDAYQAEGFKARVVTCMPKDTLDNDCHVITVVWSKTLNKWVWMDPTFNAYVTDTKGNLLNIEEVRARLVNNGTTDLILNNDANWNNQNKQTKEYYLGYYMSKNLYWIQCAAKSEWDLETFKEGKPATEYINLYPGTYNTLHQEKKVLKGSIRYAIGNPDYFWQKPAGI